MCVSDSKQSYSKASLNRPTNLIREATMSIRPLLSRAICLGIVLLSSTPTLAHDGPDPIARWRFSSPDIKKSSGQLVVNARLGPAGVVVGKSQMLGSDSAAGECLFLSGGRSAVTIAKDYSKADIDLPREMMTLSATISVDKPLRWGGIVSALQDNGSEEFGWVLGYNEETFSFGLASEGGKGRLTYLDGKTKYELGKLYHVVAVYDGKTMQLFVNGKLDAASNTQTGKIAYPASAPLTLGAYHDADEFFGHRGRLNEIAIYSSAAKPAWVAHSYQHVADLASKPAAPVYEPLEVEIDPYLQFGTRDAVTVMWKTNRPSSGRVYWGENSECPNLLEGKPAQRVHEIRIEGLQAETQYFYRVESGSAQEKIRSDVFPFATAVEPSTPFAFAVISDTQGNPTVSGKLAEFAWAQRPNFLLHPGDLVSTGPNDSHWTEHFFPSMHPLIRHVPFYPVLGNHEQNAKNYFDYVSLPAPEYYYNFEYGNAEFFMIDSNRNVQPGSEQFRWLEEKLAASKAKWKIVCHHHPPYSSDENDYGNLWKTNKSTRGDLRVRKLVPLYEKYNVDIVWNGHIHSYERTWPLKQNQAVALGGPVYMITGGGGGGLETPGPFRPFFQNTVRRGHHYTMVRINDNVLEMQAYDLENRLFDSMEIRK